MKRMIAILISMLFLTSSVFANGIMPEELMEYPENFTAVYSISMSIDDNSDIRKLIEEVINEDDGMSDRMGVDFLAFLSALFEYDSTVNVKADMSSDYKRIKLSITNNNMLSSVVSSNLQYTVKSKAGLWADIDLTNETEPKLDVIFLSPTSDKYSYMNVGEYITQENMDSFNAMFDGEEIQKLKDEISKFLFGLSKIEKTKTGYRLSIDNESFVQLMGKMMLHGSAYDEDFDVESLAKLQNMQFLGKDGIKAVYTFKGGAIDSAEVKADISMNLSSIAKAMDEEWPYEASGIINIKLSEKADFVKIGTTVVKIPALNDSNSISLNKIIEEEMMSYDSYESYDEYTFEYPYSYVSVYSDTLPVVDGNYYVPLRGVLEDGYEDAVSVSYQNGVITASSEYFPGFETLTMTVGDDKVYADGAEHISGRVMLIDGVTYVSTGLFTDVFNWELCDITHNVLENIFSVDFWTYK